MGHIDGLERELKDLTMSLASATQQGRLPQWVLELDEFNRAVRQTISLAPNLKAEIEHKIVPGIEILNDVLIGMKHEEREE